MRCASFWRNQLGTEAANAARNQKMYWQHRRSVRRTYSRRGALGTKNKRKSIAKSKALHKIAQREVSRRRRARPRRKPAGPGSSGAEGRKPGRTNDRMSQRDRRNNNHNRRKAINVTAKIVKIINAFKIIKTPKISRVFRIIKIANKSKIIPKRPAPNTSANAAQTSSALARTCARARREFWTFPSRSSSSRTRTPSLHI